MTPAAIEKGPYGKIAARLSALWRCSISDKVTSGKISGGRGITGVLEIGTTGAAGIGVLTSDALQGAHITANLHRGQPPTVEVAARSPNSATHRETPDQPVALLVFVLELWDSR